MIDLIIANPCISQNELARHFGYTPGWVSQIISSDAFQAKMAERTKDIIDPTLKAGVEDRFRGIVFRSMEILQEKLNRPTADIPDNLALRSLELGSRALGYGGNRDTPAVSINISAHLEELGGRLTSLLRKEKTRVIEMENADE